MRLPFRLVIAAALPIFAAAAPCSAQDASAKLDEVKAAQQTQAAARTDATIAEAQKTSLTAARKAEKQAFHASYDPVLAAYESSCPNGYPAERKASCDAQYAQVHSMWAADDEKYRAYSRAWDAQDAAQKAAQVRLEEAAAKVRRMIDGLSAAFPGCPTGTSDLALQAAYNCMSAAFDKARHEPAAIDGNGKMVWNDYNPNVKALHDQYLALEPKLNAVNAKLADLYAQPVQDGMAISALKQRRSVIQGQLNGIKSKALGAK